MKDASIRDWFAPFAPGGHVACKVLLALAASVSLWGAASAGEMSREMFGPTGSPVQTVAPSNCYTGTTFWRPATTTYYAPSTTTYYAPSLSTSYYAPTVAVQPTTTYYAPSVVVEPTTTYYAPTTAVAQPVTTYYAPSTVVQPVTTYYAPSAVVTPVTSFYAPVTTYYAPATVVQPVVVGPAFVPGQPIRNNWRARRWVWGW
jgi:hypothetical protein